MVIWVEFLLDGILSGISAKLDSAELRLAVRRRDRMVAELQGGWKPLSPEEAEKLLEEYSFEGPREASKEIDKVLYG